MSPIDDDSSRPSKPVWLSDFIRRQRDVILADWMAAIRGLPIARDLARPALLDHLPALLERIAEMIDAGDPVPEKGPERAPTAHALERLGEGYGLGEVVTEYAMLRECILRHWERDGVRAADPSELRVLNRAIDHAIAISVAHFTSARERTLRALDRISAAALGTDNLDAFLPALLLVLRETAPAVDWATLRLREGDVFVVRAAVGLEEAAAGEDSAALGEGFAGLVARDARMLLTHAATEDPRVTSAAIRAAGTRALLGLPLVHDGVVIGVGEIGSRTATDFSDEDKMLFNVMATRATAMIEQHRLRELAERRAADAVRAMRARDEVVAIVSHDLRNPLAAIMTAAVLIEQTPDATPGVLRKAEVIQRCASRMSRLLEDLLDVSRIEAGAIVLERAPQSPEALVHEAVEMQRALADERGLQLLLDVAASLPDVQADRERVQRVFGNLLGNALKFTPTGGAITVAAVRDGEKSIRFSVADTGPGIGADDLPHIFDRYWQSRGGSREGAGLGLAIVRGLVEAHGGRVDAESVVGHGTKFVFTLPITAG